MKIRILTLNIHKGFSFANRRFVLPRLRRAIRETRADLVFLQEVVGENSILASKHIDWPEEAQHEFIATDLWAHRAYGKNARYPHGHHGNAIISHFPIVFSEQVDISTNILEQRGFLHAIIALPEADSELHCLCVHLGLFGRSRHRQLRWLAEYVAQKIPSRARLVLAGDFNDWRGRCVVDFTAFPDLKDVALAVNGGRVATFPAWMPLLPLDRIYVAGLQALSLSTFHDGGWKNLSDHAALLAEGELL